MREPWPLFASDLAPYRKINQRISMDPATSEYELICQAEGYPEAEVIWTNSDHQSLSGKTTITTSQTEEQLLNVTSSLRVNATANDVFYCTFWRFKSGENHTAELIIPGELTTSVPGLLVMMGICHIHLATVGWVYEYFTLTFARCILLPLSLACEPWCYLINIQQELSTCSWQTVG